MISVSFIALKKNHPFFYIPWEWLIMGMAFIVSCLFLSKIPDPGWIVDDYISVDNYVFISQLIIIPFSSLIGVVINF